MATFSVEIVKIEKIESIPNADAIECAVVGEYRSIIKKGQFEAGQLAAYIPESALVPETLLKEMGLYGRLSGSEKNRVKAIKLRGVISQGLLYPKRPEWSEGQDVAEILGITKYEPRIPAQFAGEQGFLKPRVINGEVQGQSTITLKFDIENFKKWNRVLEYGEEVVMTEKIHGTFFCIGVVPEEYQSDDLLEGKYVVSSKGLIKNGIFIKANSANVNNTYIKAALKFGLGEVAEKIRDNLNGRPTKHRENKEDQVEVVWIMGEVFGRSVQKLLDYGVPSGDLSFRAFDVKTVSKSGRSSYMNFHEFQGFMEYHKVPTVPLIYTGPFSKEKLLKVTNGKETITGKSSHIREGVIVKPIHERSDAKLGRVILKSVSDAYLEKSDGDEMS